MPCYLLVTCSHLSTSLVVLYLVYRACRYKVQRDTEDYRDYRDHRNYLTARPGSLTGEKNVTGGKLPYFPGNFWVNTEFTENSLFCGNVLPGNSQPS